MARRPHANTGHTDHHTTPVPAAVTVSGVSTIIPLTLVSTDSAGNIGNGLSWNPVISADGTKVLFTSQATNLATLPYPSSASIYLKDLTTGITTLVDSEPLGSVVYGGSVSVVFSPDSSKILYTNNLKEIWIKDIATGSAVLASSSATGEAANAYSSGAVFSPDGTKVAFLSAASNLVANDTNGSLDLFTKDLATGIVNRIEINHSPQIALDYNTIVFSPDGTKIAISTNADGLVAGDTNGIHDIFVIDLASGAITLVSNSTTGSVANAVSADPAFSADSNSISFSSLASNLISNDLNAGFDVFVKNLTTGVTTLASTDASGLQISTYNQSFVFSPDGKTAAFVSNAGLIPGTSTQGVSIYLKDLATGALTLVPGAYPDGYVNGGNYTPSFSADGKTLIFSAYAQYDNNGVPSENYGVFTFNIAAGLTPPGEIIKGGAGFDTATYETSTAAVIVDLRHADGTSNTGDALKDTYVSIENFKLSNFDDTFIGLNTTGAKNSASGLDGADTFISGGRGTANSFDGGNGNDTFKGGIGTDKFIGGAGDDRFTGGGGKDVMIGGTGADTFIFNLRERGTETITDFELGVDHLQFNGISARQVLIHLDHGHVQIEIDHGLKIILDNITDINALKHDMLFV
jgi:trimeric autotransporter adhesin